MRRRLPRGVRMYTGDDFNFAAADRRRRARALRRAARHLRRDRAGGVGGARRRSRSGDRARFDAILAPTVPLSRHIFAAPTRFYKTGVVFMAWLNGHQSHFTMVGGQQSARSLVHLAELFRLADAAGLLRDPDLAAARMRTLLACNGIERDGGSPTPACCRSTRRRCARSGRCREIIDGLRAPRHPRHLAVARPGCRGADSRRAASRIRDAGLARHGLLPRRHVPGRGPRRAGARRTTTTGARSTKRSPSARTASCWWSAACRRIATARIVARTWPARARWCATASASSSSYARRAGMPLAIEPLHPMYAADRACVNTLAHANDLCDELGRRRSASRSTSITSGGTRSSSARSSARARARRRACSRITSATGSCRPPTC